MKQILFILLVTLSSLTVTAQKQTYLLIAYGQKRVNGMCGEKIMIQQEEVSLMPAETIAYRSKLYNQISATYSKGYTNIFVHLVAPSQAVILYEREYSFTRQKDGWDCTTTTYGCKIEKDMLAAEKAYAAWQAESKTSTFKEVRRWGKQAVMTPAAIGENDLDVQWTANTKGYLLNMKNTRKDLALQVTIVSYKRKSGTYIQAGSETDLSKMTKSGETTVTVEPGYTSQNFIAAADAFEVKISPNTATKDKQGVINKIKQQLRIYLKSKNGKIEIINSSFGVRG